MTNILKLKRELPDITGRFSQLVESSPELSPVIARLTTVLNSLDGTLSAVEAQQKNMELSQLSIQNLNDQLSQCLREAKSHNASQETAELFQKMDELMAHMAVPQESFDSEIEEGSDQHLDMLSQLTLATSEIEDEMADRKGNIIVTSASPNTLGALERRLKAAGHNVTAVQDQAEVIAHIERQKFDTLIVDAETAEDNGKALLAEVRDEERFGYIPVIFMGPLKDTLVINQSLEGGADDFLPKPPNPALLKARVASALEKKAMHDARQKRIEEIKANQRDLEESIMGLAEGIAIFDRQNKLLMHNDSLLNIYPHLRDLAGESGLRGVSFEEIIRANLKSGIYKLDGDQAQDRDHRQHVLADRISSFALPNGSWEESLMTDKTLQASSYRTPDGGAVLTVQDISENLADQEKLTFMAYHDALTGLANRVMFNQKLDEIFKRGVDNGGHLSAIVNIDLDGFKAVNDTHGHEAGDWILIQVAQRLRNCIREHDTVARFGGDEFCVLVDLAEDRADVEAVAGRVLDSICQPYQREDGTVLNVGGSIGIAIFPGNGADAEELMSNADMAMYASKKDGKGQYQFY